MTPNQMAMMAGGSALVAIAHNYFRSSNLPSLLHNPNSITVLCSKANLLSIILDLRMEYTPHYLHYYHMVCAVE